MLWFFAVGAAIGAALWVAVRIELGLEPVSANDSGPGSAGKGARLPGPEADARRAVPGPAGWQAAAPGSGQRRARTAAMPALGDDAHGLAFLELSTHPGREQGAVHLQDLVLEPDEGLILRIGLIQRGMRSRTHERIGVSRVK